MLTAAEASEAEEDDEEGEDVRNVTANRDAPAVTPRAAVSQLASQQDTMVHTSSGEEQRGEWVGTVRIV